MKQGKEMSAWTYHICTIFWSLYKKTYIAIAVLYPLEPHIRKE